jgi:hypothetical protein
MRRSIRLTGRKQLAQSSFRLSLMDVGEKRLAAFSILKPTELQGFPPDSEVRVKLVENKLVEVLHFGSISKPTVTVELSDDSFRAPSCQVRIVSREAEKSGMLLGSTNPWTLKSGGDPDGILLFQPADIKPRLWRLDIRDNGQEHPILYVDERIPDASLWARSDPVFAACVLPYVVTEVMRKVLALNAAPDDGWEADWLAWAAAMMPGSKAPFNANEPDRETWIEELIATFSLRHDLAGQALAKIGMPL